MRRLRCDSSQVEAARSLDWALSRQCQGTGIRKMLQKDAHPYLAIQAALGGKILLPRLRRLGVWTIGEYNKQKGGWRMLFLSIG